MACRVRSVKRVLLLSVVVGLMASPVSSQPNHDIVLFSDDECTSCNLQIAQGETKTFYIKLRGDGPLGLGQVVDFRVAGVPEGWPYSVTLGPHVPEAELYGDPLGDQVVAGVDAPSSGNSCVTLFVIELTATTDVADLVFSVEKPIPSPNPLFQCPTITICAPCDGRFCVPGGKLLVNSQHDCTVAVTSRTWSTVRELYR